MKLASRQWSAASLTLCAMLFALWSVADAQQPATVYRIGYLSSLDPAREYSHLEGIRLSLHVRRGETEPGGARSCNSTSAAI